MNALNALSDYMLIGIFLLIAGLALSWLLDLSQQPERVPSVEKVQRPGMAQRECASNCGGEQEAETIILRLLGDEAIRDE